MKSQKLFEEIGGIDDHFVSEANTNTLRAKSSKRLWIRWTSVAAAACLVIAAMALLLPKQNNDIVADLPVLTISKDENTMGFEGHLAYDIKELRNGNPWSINESIATLPVFQNTALYDFAGFPLKGLSSDAMMQKAKDIASLMGLTLDSVYTNPTEADLQKQIEKEQSVPGNADVSANATPIEAVAVCGDVTIKVGANGAIRIFFEKGVQLPDQYSVTYHETSEQQAQDVIRYLLEQYKEVVDMQAPELALFGDYTYQGQRNFSYGAYENSGSLTDRILGFNFNFVRFSPNDDGVLWIIDRHTMDLSQKLGDYPIITAKEAQELLLQKHYITTVPEELPGAEYIAGVELIYRTGRYDEVFMPYYRFLVEMPNMQRDNGLKTFGAFYVPAVEGRYLINMPLWDGSFN